MTTVAAQNFKISLSLAEANTVRRALEAFRDSETAAVLAAGGSDNLPARAQDADQANTILRRDF